MKATYPLLMALALCAFGVCPLDAPVQAKDDKQVDPYVLYRVAGRTWMLKRVPKPGNEGGDTSVTYMRYEVTNVYADRAEVREDTLDAGKKMPDDGGFVVKIDFKPDALAFKDPPGFTKKKIEKVKTDVGTFECVRWENNMDGLAVLWKSIEFPGMTVKQDDRFGERVLVEFMRVEGDPGYVAPKSKKKKKSAQDLTDARRLFKEKGRYWTLKTTTLQGTRGNKNFEVLRYEVIKVEAEQATIEITKLSLTLEKLKGEEVQTLVIKFDDSFLEHLQPLGRSREDRVEKRITDCGMFECQVFTFTDADGREGKAWYTKDWPGLMVRQEIVGDNYRRTTEILQFSE